MFSKRQTPQFKFYSGNTHYVRRVNNTLPVKEYFYYNKAAKLKTTLDQETFQNVGITGFSRIFGSASSKGRRIFWVLVVIASFMMFTCHIGFRFELYFNSSPSTKITYVENYSVAYPSIALCPSLLPTNPKFNFNVFLYDQSAIDTLFDEVFNYIEKNVTDIESFWEKELNHHMKGFTVFMNMGRSFRKIVNPINSINVSQTISPTGLCNIYSPGSHNHIEGEDTFVKFRKKSTRALTEKYFQVLVFSKESKYMPRYFPSFIGHYTKFGTTLYLKYKITENYRLNISSAPCSSANDVADCIENCLEDQLYKKISNSSKKVCRLPYMIPKDNIPLCNITDLKEIYEQTEDALLHFDARHCRCHRKCYEVTYSLHFYNVNSHVRNDTIIFVAVDSDVQLIEEYWFYTVGTLLSDIGGSMGLFLGICCLTFVEVLEIVFIRFTNISKNLKVRSFQGT